MTTDTLEPVIVDTSVFVEFFRGKSLPYFERLLLNDQILLSPYVRLELIQGVRKNELHTLEYVLGGLEVITHTDETFLYGEEILHQLKSSGIQIGIIDLLIAAEAHILKCPIYSFDKAFHFLAQRDLIILVRETSQTE